MKLITHTPVVYSREGFPRDERGNPFIPGTVIKEAIESAAIFYFVKKDRQIESRVRKILSINTYHLKEIQEEIKRTILQKFPALKELAIPEKVYIPVKDIKISYVEIFDLNRWEEIESFKTEMFEGILEIKAKIPHFEKIRAISHSFAESLAKIELSLLKDHPLKNIFYQHLIDGIKRWEIPLRIGMWTETLFKGDLLFFWRIKEVREMLFKRLKADIRPKQILYIPFKKQTAGWIEIKKD